MYSHHRFGSIAGVLLSGAVAAAQPAPKAPLELAADISLPGVRGRIDHMAFDAQGNRLFVAALGNNTLEVVDLNARRVARSVTGLGEPQGALYLNALNRLYVTNGSADRVDVMDSNSLQTRNHFARLEDADNVRYDPATRRVYVGYGKGALRVIDPVSEQTTADIALSGHPESFQLESSGDRIFVNVPDRQHIAVVDKQKRVVIANWSTPGVTRNFPMALDEIKHRLFVGARRPAVMLVYDTTSGNVVARLPIGEDTDDIFFDAERERVYVICGEGRVDIFQQESADRYTAVQSLRTSPGARTGLLTQDSRLFIAAPANSTSPARILVYQIH